MEQISNNFKMAEFRVTNTGLSNEIPENVKPAIRALVDNLLQPICDGSGWRCGINSGYRSQEVNRRVGGASTSQHLKGEAADCVFYVAPITVMREVVRLGLDFDQMIAYPSFVHLSYTTTRPNRKQILYDKSYNGSKL